MTVFNEEKYLTESISSILKQTYKQFEFIIVDDGSSDNSKNIILSFEDNRIRYINLPHVGRSAALNYGVEQVKTPFITFFDADDIMLPDCLRKQYELFQMDIDLRIVSTWYVEFENNKNEIKKTIKYPIYHSDIVDLMPICCSLCFPSTMIKKESLLRIGKFNENINAAIDYEILLRLIKTEKCQNIAEILLQKRIRPEAISQKKRFEQNNNAYQLAKLYLEEKINESKSKIEINKYNSQMGIMEYYRGSMKMARQYLLRAFKYDFFDLRNWRYYAASFLGDKIFIYLRKKKISNKINVILSSESMNKKYFIP